MELLHKLLMFRKVLKVFFLIVTMWIVSLLTIVKEYRRGDLGRMSESDLYEQALVRLSHDFRMKNVSAFRAWDYLPRGNGSISDEEKLSLVIGYDYPPGAYGRPVLLEKATRYELKELIRSGWRDHDFNMFVSDLIPVNRSLPDPRDNWCRNQNYSTSLPTATVIICFFNEALSTLIRTITSVLNRTPSHLLDQIILVDDNSTFTKLQEPLEDYVRTKSKITIIRAPERLGIIRARMLPIPLVKSPVIVYLDSHCECTEGWLEPLLKRISEDPTRVVSPVIDHINPRTFEYIAQDSNDLRLGGFNWDLKYIWIGIPQDIYMKRKHQSDPIDTPTVAGGLLAINKAFFEKIGLYDSGMEIWGGENLELSFKTWMCGGSLEIIPCSHVGHIFRKRIPYEEKKRSLRKNFVRLAEVWLDDYAKYYYERIGNKKGDYGNISARVELRQKLNCKSFHWYLENVYPQLHIPDNFVASGRIYSASDYALCLDVSLYADNPSVDLIPCHFEGGNQFWYYSKQGEIRRDDMCLDYKYNAVTIFYCNNHTSQVWLYFPEEQIIRHMATEQCWNIARFVDGEKIVLTNCVGSRTQRWVIENYDPKKVSPELLLGINDIKKTLFYKKVKNVFNSTLENDSNKVLDNKI